MEKNFTSYKPNNFCILLKPLLITPCIRCQPSRQFGLQTQFFRFTIISFCLRGVSHGFVSCSSVHLSARPSHYSLWALVFSNLLYIFKTVFMASCIVFRFSTKPSSMSSSSWLPMLIKTFSLRSSNKRNVVTRSETQWFYKHHNEMCPGNDNRLWHLLFVKRVDNFQDRIVDSWKRLYLTCKCIRFRWGIFKWC